MRIVVTGSGGAVGRAFLVRAAGDHQVVGFTHRDLPVEDRDQVRQRIREARPDLILHLAAMTAVDACEGEPDRAFSVNARGTANLAEAAGESGAVLVYTSTDYVFDGEKNRPYVESDPPNPLSVYARSKLAGEEEASRGAPDHLLVRTGWLFGSGNDFFSRSVRGLAEGGQVTALVDRTGTPTYVPHLVDALLALMAAGQRGLVHVAGPEPTTWFDLLDRARELGRLPGELGEQRAADLSLPAPRPRYSALASEILPLPGVAGLPPLDAALSEMLERVG